MPRYLVQASYTASGAAGLLKEGGTARREAVRKLLEQWGGRLESMDYAFGADDVFITFELPSNVDAAAIALTVAASGALQTRTTVLLTPEEIDEAATRSIDFHPPGAGAS
jgi:uncharacterized protein with GYD domain